MCIRDSSCPRVRRRGCNPFPRSPPGHEFLCWPCQPLSFPPASTDAASSSGLGAVGQGPSLPEVIMYPFGGIEAPEGHLDPGADGHRLGVDVSHLSPVSTCLLYT